MSTRATCLAAWHGSRRHADVNGSATMTAPAWAGYALEMADDVRSARMLVPSSTGAFWGRVYAALDAVETGRAEEDALVHRLERRHASELP